MAVDDEVDRFGFGENWTRFLAVLDESRIAEAERSLVEMVGHDAIAGRTWLDAGSGSGLFSLAAARLGAARLRSFDYDLHSVACTAELRSRHGADADHWAVERGSVLDGAYVEGLGGFDLVYCWGVLHHTGDLWTGFDNVAGAVAPGGLLFVAIYNDRGWRSRVWGAIKRRYNRLPPSLRVPYTVAVMSPIELATLGLDTARRRPWNYVRRWTRYRSARGMSRWHDMVDWVGGHPYEPATAQAVFDRGRALGLTLERMELARGTGCSQFVFRRG